MKRILIASLFALCLLGGSALPVVRASIAYAQENPPVAPANTDANDPAKKKTGEGVQQTAPDASYSAVMEWVMRLFAWLLGVAALTLDTAVYHTVVHMGAYVNDLSAVGVVWRVLRDFGNVLLIFGFLAVGISIMLGVSWYGSASSMLPKLLIAAIFLNFSLFIAEAVIDVGNLFATQFYVQITGGQTPGTSWGDKSFFDAADEEGISNKIMSQLGLQTMYGNALQTNTPIFDAGNTWIIGFMGILLFMVAAFVMFSLAFILIARFVALVVLIIVAPIGIVGFAIPKFNLSKKWWNELIGQTITAPVMLLMLYIALALITDAKFLTGFGVGQDNGNGDSAAWLGWIGGSTGVSNFASMMLSFFVAMGLLLTVTLLAKKLSAIGASMATGAAGKIVGGVAGYGVLGGSAFVARGVLGMGAGSLLNSKDMQARAAQPGWSGRGAAALAWSGRQLQNRTFDARNSKILSGIGRTVTAPLSIVDPSFNKSMEYGKGTKSTGASMIKGLKEAKHDYLPFNGEWWRAQQKEYEKAAAQKARSAAIDNRADDPKAFATEIKKMSVDELSELRGIRKGLDEFVLALSPAKFNELSKSPKLLSSEKTNLKKEWEGQFNNAETAGKVLAGYSTEEVATLDPKILTKPQVAQNLDSDQLESIRRKGNLNREQRTAIFTSLTSTPELTDSMLEYLAADPTGSREKYWDLNGAAGGKRTRT